MPYAFCVRQLFPHASQVRRQLPCCFPILWDSIKRYANAGPQALRDKAIIPASAAARMRFAFVFFIILFSFLLLIVIYVHKPWGLRFFLCRVLSDLPLTSVFSAEVQAVEDFIPAGHKGLR